MVYSAVRVKVFAAALLASTAVTGLQLDAFEVVQRDHVGSPAARAVGAYAQGQDVRRDDVFDSANKFEVRQAKGKKANAGGNAAGGNINAAQGGGAGAGGAGGAGGA
ncbi:hypothetical protein INS49_015865 [Diaporthe citri]|uniref:uncharacterized protein n=1 Tax=Diaporthe citri TaxID=83186 RepID=UPI001C7E8C80|nr:uncharacterized protein INS49_015865 [Diaporthe citri]KAG6356477.1 hypothetical protein INS49_015865 [Diaporthe citri]